MRPAASPNPVETSPSIPLAPRFPKKRCCGRACGQKDSTARIGMLEPMNSCPGSGSRELNARTTWPSCIGVETSVAAIAAEARFPAATHWSRHPTRSSGGSASSRGCGSQSTMLVATWSWSRHAWSGSIRKVGADAAASHLFKALEVGIPPNRITRSGPCWSDQPARNSAS